MTKSSVLDCLSVKTDDKLVSLIVLLDPSAAFDTLDHSILPKRLEVTFGVQDDALQWFASYFGDRCQSVTVDGTVSAPSPLSTEYPRVLLWDLSCSRCTPSLCRM